MSDIDLITRNLQSVVQTDEGRCRFINAILAVGLENDGARLAALKVIPYAAYLKTDGTNHFRSPAPQDKDLRRFGNFRNSGRISDKVVDSPDEHGTIR